MATTMEVKVENTPAVLELPEAQLHATINYYSLPTPPSLDDLSILDGTSPNIASHKVPVADLRSLPLSSYNHSTHGFQVLHQPLAINPSHEFVHDPTILTSQYYPSIISLLKEQLHVRSTVVINSTLRDIPAPDPSAPPMDYKNPRPTTGGASLFPFSLAHSDYTPGGARTHLRAMTPDWFSATGTADGCTSADERTLFLRLRDEIIDAEDRAMRKAGLEPGDDYAAAAAPADGGKKKGGYWTWDGRGYDGPRYAMFSVWRPWETVRRDPLAVLLAPAADPDGCVALPRMYRNRPGCVSEYYNENALVRPPARGGEQVWGYISEQKPEEVLALKFYDSEALRRGDGSVRLMCPHSAFTLPGTEDQPARRSCELRVWCIW
ncbi:GA4 desaturase [Hypoxylon fragiforme]|uniref:GA4 desaturase n=1 Tax=Hypoxylon fragiforme TaxID=63214 RepID=UPI0020C6F950|nr:GA4 desaturase [Hypoxylon fragiforme]KAI2609841.1 GA4 desaturase [Hypoxylon fragiforme]